MKISLLEPLGVPESVVRELSAELTKAGHEFVYYDTKTTDKKELAERSKDSDVVMIANNPYPDEVVEAAEKLKMLAVAFTGIDHVGLAACRKKGVTVCNCAGYSNETVAELAVGLAIGVLRHILPADEATRTGKTAAGLTGREICGRTVGIVGTGRIGVRTAQLFKAFGATVLGCARHESEEAKAAGIRFAGLEELLQKSDIVSLHLPLTAETRKTFGKKQFDAMKPGSIFLNCARGAIVDNQALADALNSGKIAGAGVDVFDMEPPIPEEYPLLHAKNILLTPHVAFASEESMLRRAKIEFANVAAYLSGSPENVCKIG
ncbi:Glycerate dehydrogenase [Caprobacter fermentans]|uniref:Glycerate dehydrogenase n=1 Tax=Caproicibacter fermentans TaxID=2576756 RepID=A0A6N8I0M4_9FIRM|nr:2-hydroxyacid dehydrogenase [Caproicibacter fermentans]MVB11681.1 Glycerate dehydrogenase [Caproicibacter fermentans]OCN02622.1 hydroxyacid dehydrogenase [Clostridium sp. W14A]